MMKIKNYWWVFAFLVLIGCQPELEPAVVQAPRVGKIVPEGEPIRIDLQSTTERIPNCSGSSTNVTKLPSTTIVTGHSVEWEVGGEIGFGVTIGEGVLPFGVDLSSALEGSLTEGFDNGFTQSSGWELSAAPGEIVEYTLAWWEIWQSGYIDVTLADRTVTRVNVRYRSGIQSDIIGQSIYGCNGEEIVNNSVGSKPEETSTLSSTQNNTIAPVLPVATSTNPSPVAPTSPPTSVVSTSNSNCPLIVIEGSVGGLPISQTKTWAELSEQGTTRENQSSNLGDACSRDSDDRVQVWVGYWSDDPGYLDFRGSMSVNQAVSLVQQNSNQPVIILPWGG